MDSSIVDHYNEAPRMRTAIQASYSVTSHSTKASWISSLSATCPPAFAVIPEQEVGSIGLTSAEKGAILQYLNAGGRLVVGHYGNSKERAMLNALLGWSLVQISCSSTSLQNSAVYGFAGAPASLPYVNDIACCSVGSLPTGATVVYGTSSAASVAST